MKLGLASLALPTYSAALNKVTLMLLRSNVCLHTQLGFMLTVMVNVDGVVLSTFVDHPNILLLIILLFNEPYCF